MKRLALCLLVAAACGGGNKSSSTTMPKTEPEAVARPAAPDCKAAADHMAAGNADVASGLESRCEQDQWSADARQCLAEKPEDTCPLTDAQKASVADARAKAGLEEGRMGKKEAPAPEEQPKTRGAVKKKPAGDGKTADPCEGGE